MSPIITTTLRLREIRGGKDHILGEVAIIAGAAHGGTIDGLVRLRVGAMVPETMTGTAGVGHGAKEWDLATT